MKQQEAPLKGHMHGWCMTLSCFSKGLMQLWKAEHYLTELCVHEGVGKQKYHRNTWQKSAGKPPKQPDVKKKKDKRQSFYAKHCPERGLEL